MSTFEKKCNEHGFKKIGIYGNRSTLEAISSSLKKDGEQIEIGGDNRYTSICRKCFFDFLIRSYRPQS